MLQNFSRQVNSYFVERQADISVESDMSRESDENNSDLEYPAPYCGGIHDF